MILTDRQAHLLVQILQDSLNKNVNGYFRIGHKNRLLLQNEIINQQSDKPIQLSENKWPIGHGPNGKCLSFQADDETCYTCLSGTKLSCPCEDYTGTD